MLMKISEYIRDNLSNNTILKSVFMISGGTAFAQVLTTLTTPIVTRIYSTSEYGILTLFNSIISILGIAGALKYEMSIPIAESEDKAKDSLILSIVVLLCTSAIVTILLAITGENILDMLGARELYTYWYMVPIGIFCVQLFAIFVQYAYRNKDFKVISKTTIKQSVVGNVIKLLLGVIGAGPIGLLFSRILSESVGTVALAKPILKEFTFKDINRENIRSAARRYYQFPLYQFPSTILGQLVINMPVFFLGVIYNSAIVGAFGLANTVVNLSMDLIGKSVGNVFYAEAAKIGKNNPKQLKHLSNSIIKKMALIGLIPLAILIVFAPELFIFVFGDEWKEAGYFARILSISTYFSFVLNPVSRVFEVYEKQSVALFLNIIKVISLVVIFVLASYFLFSTYMTIFFYAIANTGLCIITFLYARRFMEERIQA